MYKRCTGIKRAAFRSQTQHVDYRELGRLDWQVPALAPLFGSVSIWKGSGGGTAKVGTTADKLLKRSSSRGLQQANTGVKAGSSPKAVSLRVIPAEEF
jgi:hypothetical protein